MFLEIPATFRASLLTSYLNGFRAEPTLGTLTVSRFFPHDDVDPSRLTIARERFQEHQSPQIVGEIEEAFQGIQNRLVTLKARGESFPRILAGAWNLSQYTEGLLTMRGPGGRLVEYKARSSEFVLRVGHMSDRSSAHDRQTHLTIAADRSRNDHQLRCEYEFGFGSGTFDGLLRFLGVDLTTERLEYMSRDLLWKPIRSRLESDGYQFDKSRPYRCDHHGLSWKATSPEGEPLHGHFWVADEYPALQLVYPSGLSVIPPSFLPLWNQVQGDIRRSESIPEVIRHRDAESFSYPKVNA